MLVDSWLVLLLLQMDTRSRSSDARVFKVAPAAASESRILPNQRPRPPLVVSLLRSRSKPSTFFASGDGELLRPASGYVTQTWAAPLGPGRDCVEPNPSSYLSLYRRAFADICQPDKRHLPCVATRL